MYTPLLEKGNTIATAISRVLTASESNSTVTNYGASGLIVLTLPAAVVGLRYTIVNTAGQPISIAGQAGDTMYGDITNNTLNAFVIVAAMSAGVWGVTTHSNWLTFTHSDNHFASVESWGVFKTPDGRNAMAGDNTSGRFGNGTTVSSSSPVLIPGTWAHLATYEGVQTLAIAADGSLWTWGSNSFGQLGLGDTTGRSTPTSVAGGRSYSAVACGENFSLALEAGTGVLYGWGRNNTGQLGVNNTADKSIPTQVVGSRSFSAISGGKAHFVALELGTGIPWGSGFNGFGNFGDGTATSRSSPVSTVGSRSYTSVSCGYNDTMLIEGSTGFAWVMGFLHGVSSNASSPISITGGRSYTQISIGVTALLLEGSSGMVFCCGRNNSGECGNNATTTFGVSSPTPIARSSSYTKISARGSDPSPFSAWALDADGTLWSWGSGDAAKGVGDVVSHSSPVAVLGIARSPIMLKTTF